jgi:hypothetical protein
MSTLSLRSVTSPNIKPSGVIRNQKATSHASKWNAMASRRAELGLNKVAVTTKVNKCVTVA